MRTNLKPIIKTILSSIFILLIITGCKKEGPAGKDGNANVKSVTFTANSWAWNSSQYWRYASWTNISILTSSVANGGSVMLYQSLGNGSWIALPMTANAGGATEQDWFIYSPGNLSVIIELSDLSDPNPPALTYRLVCIEASALKAHPEVDIKNYEMVKNTFGLKE